MARFQARALLIRAIGGCVAAALLPAAAPAAERAITIGATQRFEIPAGDRRATRVGLALRPVAPVWVTIDARSLDCDLDLRAERVEGDGTATDPAADDDGGGGGNSRLSMEVAAGAAYRLSVGCRDHDDGAAVEVAVAAGRVEALAGEAKASADVAYFHAVLAHAEERGVPAGQLRALRNLANLSRAAGDFREAQSYLDRAQPIFDQVNGPDSRQASQNINNRGVLRLEAGDLAGARDLVAQALALDERTLGTDNEEVGSGLNNLAAIEDALGDFENSRRHYERALEVRERAHGTESEEVAQTTANLGVMLRNSGFYDDALPLIERALALDERLLGPDHLEVAIQCNNLAATVQPLGDYARAQRLYERAIAITGKAKGPDDPDLALLLNNLATLQSSLGLETEARALIERGLDIRARRLGPDHPAVAQSYAALGLSHRGGGDLAAARRAYENALAIAEKALGPDHLQVAASLQNLGSIERASGNFAVAVSLLARSIAIYERAAPSHPALAGALDSLALTLEALGRAAEALPLFDRGVALREEGLGPDHPDTALIRANRAACRARLGQWSLALQEALEAERIARDHLRLTARALPEERGLAYDATRPRGLHLALSISLAAPTAGPADQVWDALMRSRALILDEMAARHRNAVATSDPEVARVAEAFSVASRRLANLVVRGPAGTPHSRYKEDLDVARRGRDAAEEALAAASPAFRDDRRGDRVGYEEVLRRLPAGAALVAYLEFRRRDFGADARTPAYAAFVQPAGGGAPSLVSIGPGEAIDARVASWQEAIARGAGAGREARGLEDGYRDRAGDLRRAVWDPIAARLEGARLVFVVPDGALNFVSFAALPAEDGGYLLERGPAIHILSAERDLALLPAAPSSGAGLLALGGPAFDTAAAAGGPDRQDAGATRRPAVQPAGPVAPATGQQTFRGPTARCRDFGALRFTPLPETAREVREVARLWSEHTPSSNAGPGTILTGAAAGEAALKREVSGRRLLHLATHGFFLGGTCVARPAATRAVAGLVVGPAASATAGDSGSTLPRDAPENPLRLAGLALAGANRRAGVGPDEEDGVLTAEEVATLDLSGVEWAVLSACETGVGQVQSGEGMLGLRRSFEVAGARTLITSLWPVDDEATRAFMAALYEARLGRGLSSADAMREAGRQVLAGRRRSGRSAHPFYWAAFVAAGDWR